MVLTIGITKVSVTENGVERTIDLADTKPGIAYGRTYVPLRFLAEIFGLKASHDGETGTIDIEENDDASTATDEGVSGESDATAPAAPSTTEGAITVPTTTEGAITVPTTTEGTVDSGSGEVGLPL